MKRCVLIVVATILCAFNINAQNLRRVEGSVKDYRGASISNATLYINGLDKTFMTQADGSFVIDVPIHCYAITVSADGYRAEYMEIDGTYMLFILRPEKRKEVAKAEEQAKIATQKEIPAIKRKEKGYNQFVDLSYSYCSVTDFLGVNYIGGYRFNPYFFLGLGTGVNFSIATPDKSKLNLPFCRPTTVNVPIYIHFKANFTKSNWSPYASISIGGRVSKEVHQTENDDFYINYNQSGLFGDITLGVDRKVTEKLSLYLGVGYKIESFLYAKYNANYTDLVQGNKLLHGFSLHVGLSF